MNNSVRTFHARSIDIQAVEVAVIADGQPTDEHAFVAIPGGTLMDAATFLALYVAAVAVPDIGPDPEPKKKQRAAEKTAPRVSARKVARPAKPSRSAAMLASEFRPPVAKPVDQRGGAPTMSGLIRSALAGGARNLEAIIGFVNSGKDTFEDRSISNVLYQMKYTHQVVRDEAGLYSLAAGNGARA